MLYILADRCMFRIHNNNIELETRLQIRLIRIEPFAVAVAVSRYDRVSSIFSEVDKVYTICLLFNYERVLFD